jgi:hypothetical protein
MADTPRFFDRCVSRLANTTLRIREVMTPNLIREGSANGSAFEVGSLGSKFWVGVGICRHRAIVEFFSRLSPRSLFFFSPFSRFS